MVSVDKLRGSLDDEAARVDFPGIASKGCFMDSLDGSLDGSWNGSWNGSLDGSWNGSWEPEAPTNIQRHTTRQRKERHRTHSPKRQHGISTRVIRKTGIGSFGCATAVCIIGNGSIMPHIWVTVSETMGNAWRIAIYTVWVAGR